MMDREKMLKGALFMTIGFFFVALFGAFLKAATVSASSWWATFIAYSFACIMQYFFILKEGKGFLKTLKLKLHIGRVFFGVLSTILYVVSMHYIPFLDAVLLFNTMPLFVPILAIFLLGNKISLKIWVSLFLGFLGVIFILRPDIFSIWNESGNFIALASGVTQALAFIFVKMLTKTEPIKRINFYFFFLGACLLAPFVIIFWETPPLLSWAWALSAAVTSFIAQHCITKAYHYADAAHVGPFQYSAVLFSGVIGWLIWNEIPTIWDLVGVLLVMLGGIFAITLNQNKT